MVEVRIQPCSPPAKKQQLTKCPKKLLKVVKRKITSQIHLSDALNEIPTNSYSLVVGNPYKLD